jgi:hypothetical protein
MEELESWSVGTDTEEDVVDATTATTGASPACSSPNDAVCLSLSPEVNEQLAAVVNAQTATTTAAAAKPILRFLQL